MTEAVRRMGSKEGLLASAIAVRLAADRVPPVRVIWIADQRPYFETVTCYRKYLIPKSLWREDVFDRVQDMSPS